MRVAWEVCYWKRSRHVYTPLRLHGTMAASCKSTPLTSHRRCDVWLRWNVIRSFFPYFRLFDCSLWCFCERKQCQYLLVKYDKTLKKHTKKTIFTKIWKNGAKIWFQNRLIRLFHENHFSSIILGLIYPESGQYGLVTNSAYCEGS